MLLERNDDQCNEYIYEEKREDNEIHDIKYRHFQSIVWDWAFILITCCHRILEHTEQKRLLRVIIQQNPLKILKKNLRRPTFGSLYRK